MVKKITIRYAHAIEPFLSQPKESMHLANIARELKTPHPTVRQWLNELEKKGILKKSFEGRQTRYALNLINRSLLEYAVIAEKEHLMRKCEEDMRFKELVHEITTQVKDQVLVLIFGSAVKSLKYAEDIDLLIVGKADRKEIEKIGEKLDKKIQYIEVASLAKVSPSLKVEIIKKHLILKGSEDLIRWMLW